MDQFLRNLVFSIEHPVYHSFSNDDTGLTLTYFTAKSNFVVEAFCSKNVKSGFSKPIAACDLKLIELMKICEY